jgi:uncharacterized protein (TIGR02611 family)
MDKTKRQVKRIGVGILGGAITIIGILTVPAPGPGWLIVFAGLGILATEFTWAARLLDFVKGKYTAWQAWVKSQPMVIRVGIGILIAILVVSILYLMNCYGIIDDLFHLNQKWLHSPLPFF